MFLRKLSFFAAFALLFSRAGFSAASSDFRMATELLTAARNGDIQTVEWLVNSGTDVNYTDTTGLSIVCTAIMNNDLKAAQILQVYGADASSCDAQIRRYKNKLPKENSGGLFSGLSNAQNMTLAAGGAALVIGGVVFLGDGFFGGGSGGGGGGSGGGDRPNTGNGSNGDGSGGPGTGGIATAYGPAYISAPDIESNLGAQMNLWSSGTNAVDWAYMKGNGVVQNYLYLMGGYAPFARGYTGQVAPRNSVTNGPIQLSVGSGLSPIPVALVTANGVDRMSGTAMDKIFPYAKYLCDGSSTSDCQALMHRSKNLIGAGTTEDPTKEDQTTLFSYDLSGAGSAFNADAAGLDSLLAKIIVGETYEGNTGDFIGFMPNGQLALYRTGGGKKYQENLGAVVHSDSEHVKIGITDYKVVRKRSDTGHYYDLGGADLGTTAPTGDYVIIKSDGHYYMPDGSAEYAVDNGNLWQMEAGSYKNFQALADALSKAGISGKGGVIANAALPTNMKGSGTETIGNYSRTEFLNLIDSYYGAAGTGEKTPADFFNTMNGNSAVNAPIVIFSAGEYQLGTGMGRYGSPKDATFENSAPLLYNGMDQHFMTAVAVQLYDGVAANNASDSIAFNASKKYVLSQYTNAVGEQFASRACGAAGKGAGSIDPWCFSSSGLTGEIAATTLAGAVGMAQSAFSYMNNSQIFALLALTSDGKFYSQAELEARYQLPADWLVELPASGDSKYSEKWMDLFSRAFGYGLVNLERATRPNEKLYYYSGSGSKIKINSSAGNAYWSATPEGNRAAVSLSGAFGGRAATISAPMFDFVTSSDGTESMPRVFDMTFSFDDNKYGTNLADFTDAISFDEEQDQNVTFQLSSNGAEIKNMKIKLDGFTAAYRERAMESDNPILGLAGRAASAGYETEISDIKFRMQTMAGKMTDETLLSSDPAVTDLFLPMALGNAYGFESSAQYGALSVGAGYMAEDNTTLGAYSDGLFDFGGGKTVYANAELKMGPFTAKYAAAKTETNPGFGFISGISDLYSDAYSIDADFGKWSFSLSRPLAITRGTLDYMTADYEIVESESGYDLVTNPYSERIDLAPDARETRLGVIYQPEISERTKLALGFMERLNPNNAFGHEEVVYMKIRHIW